MATATYVLVFAALCINISQQYTPFTKCSNGPSPLQIKYGSCTKSPCSFKKNGLLSTNNIVISVDFVVETLSNDLVIQAEAKDIGPYKTLAIKRGNCPYVKNTRCPLQPGQEVEFSYKFSLPFYAPKTAGLIRISMYNEIGELQTCFQMAGVIV